MQQIEIERKFLLSEIPAGLLDGVEGEAIRQGYLIVEKDHELRIRRRASTCWMTLKQGQGLARKEQECAIEHEQFEMLWPLTTGRRLEKTRYAVKTDDLLLEIDIFAGSLKPLILMEVEFESIEASRAFAVPDYVAREVTSDGTYKNASLAFNGLPS